MSGVIYKIVTGNDIYVGSSIDYEQRVIKHKSNIYNEKNNNYESKLYKTIRDNDGKYEITIYEENLSMSLAELHIYEEEVRVLLGATLNSYRAHTTKEQRKEDVRLKNIKHRAKRNERIDCECGCIVRRDYSVKHKKTAKHLKLMISLAKA
tara:strand:+ start:8 stop:460 length:453 start_codon:yes stop_codon:yes gene_type:complete